MTPSTSIKTDHKNLWPSWSWSIYMDSLCVYISYKHSQCLTRNVTSYKLAFLVNSGGHSTKFQMRIYTSSGGCYTKYFIKRFQKSEVLLEHIRKTKIVNQAPLTCKQIKGVNQKTIPIVDGKTWIIWNLLHIWEIVWTFMQSHENYHTAKASKAFVKLSSPLIRNVWN